MDSVYLCYVVLILYVIKYHNNIRIVAYFSSILSNSFANIAFFPLKFGTILSNSFANTTFFSLKFGILDIYIYIYTHL